MLTTNELKDQLVADVAEAPQNVDRTSQVRGRVAVVRRRRAVGTGVAALAGLAVAALAVVPQLNDSAATVIPSTHSSPSPESSEQPLPQYHLGGLLIAESEHTGVRPFSVPFMASSSSELMFTVDCYVPAASPVGDTMVELTIHGTVVGATSCSPDDVFTGANTYTPEPNALRDVVPGERADVAAAFRGDVPADSRVRVGIYETVPLSSYQFPQAPDPLPSLEPYGNLAPAGHQRAFALVSAGRVPMEGYHHNSVVGATGTWTKTVTLDHGLTLEGQTVAPGSVTIAVDGMVVGRFSGWDYTNAGWGQTLTLKDLGVRPGDRVTLTVTAERFPGDSWALLLSDEAP